MQDSNNDDLAWRIGELYDQLSNERSFWERIATTISEEFGEKFSKDRVRGLYRRNIQNSAQSEDSVETGGKSGDYIIRDTVNRDETIDDFIARRKIDLDIFSIVEATVNEYAGNDQMKLRLRPKMEEPFNEDEFLKKVDEVVAKYSPQKKTIDDLKSKSYIPTFMSDDDDETLFVPSIYDAHIDSPHFTANYMGHLEHMIKSGIAKRTRPSRIMFVIGNDFGHVDNDKYTTTSGTLVGAKTHYIDSVEERCSVILESTDMLRSYTPKLDIVAIPGNHDRLSTLWLSKVVESYWKNDSNVTVMSGGYPRKYYRFNKVLLGMTHGDREKNSDLVGLMATEARLDWAMAEWCEWLTGHFHKNASTYLMIDEKMGMRKRTFSPFVHPDYWHIYSGYIGNKIAGTLLMYNRQTFVGEDYFPIK